MKNVTGRFLVGLRWRNQVDPVTGTSTWVYESRSEGNFIIRDPPTWIHGPNNISDGFKRKPVLPNEFRIFWGGLIICPVLWALFGLMALFTLKVKMEFIDKEFEFLFSSFGSQFV